MRTVVVWHRRDLRLHDNALYRHLDQIRQLVPVMVFEDLQRYRSQAGDWDVTGHGPYQLQFIREAVDDLEKSLRLRGSRLAVRNGCPVRALVDVINSLADDGAKYADIEVRWHEEVGTEEQATQHRVQCALKSMGVRTLPLFGCSLFHPDDLPKGAVSWTSYAQPNQKHKRKAKKAPNLEEHYPELPSWHQANLQGMPVVMGEWRRAARGCATIRPAIPPEPIPPYPACVSTGETPSLSELMSSAMHPEKAPLFGLPREYLCAAVASAASSAHESSARGGFVGGETHALARLRDFVSSGAAEVADRSLAGVGVDNSSKLAAYLAVGCVSPRRIHDEAKSSGQGAAWLASHLEIRDYFIFKALSLGASAFSQNPAQCTKHVVEWSRVDSANKSQWQRWACGSTGLPLVDASMRELWATGFMSNRCRQNVASVLAKDLALDWRAGAELFQWLLVDHDVAANWGNWAYFCGVGSDPKNRHFCTISQSLKYDPDATYLRAWLPELRGLKTASVHYPFDDDGAQAVYAWPAPIVEPSSQLTWQDRESMQSMRDVH